MPKFTTANSFDDVDQIEDITHEVKASVVNERYQKILNRTAWLKEQLNVLSLQLQLKPNDNNGIGFVDSPNSKAIAKISEFLTKTLGTDGKFPKGQAIGSNAEGELVWVATPSAGGGTTPDAGGGGGTTPAPAPTPTPDSVRGTVVLTDRLDRNYKYGGNDALISRPVSANETWLPRNFTEVACAGKFNWFSVPDITEIKEGMTFPFFAMQSTDKYPNQPQFVREAEPLPSQNGFSAFILEPGNYLIQGLGLTTRCISSQVRLIRINPKIETDKKEAISSGAIFGSVSRNTVRPLETNDDSGTMQENGGSILLPSILQGLILKNDFFFPNNKPATFGFQIFIEGYDNFPGGGFPYEPKRDSSKIAGGFGLSSDVSLTAVHNVFSSLTISRLS